jgi:hypothetical protein
MQEKNNQDTVKSESLTPEKSNATGSVPKKSLLHRLAKYWYMVLLVAVVVSGITWSLSRDGGTDTEDSQLQVTQEQPMQTEEQDIPLSEVQLITPDDVTKLGDRVPSTFSEYMSGLLANNGVSGEGCVQAYEIEDAGKNLIRGAIRPLDTSGMELHESCGEQRFVTWFLSKDAWSVIDDGSIVDCYRALGDPDELCASYSAVLRLVGETYEQQEVILGLDLSEGVFGQRIETDAGTIDVLKAVYTNEYAGYQYEDECMIELERDFCFGTFGPAAYFLTVSYEVTNTTAQPVTYDYHNVQFLENRTTGQVVEPYLLFSDEDPQNFHPEMFSTQELSPGGSFGATAVFGVSEADATAPFNLVWRTDEPKDIGYINGVTVSSALE